MKERTQEGFRGLPWPEAYAEILPVLHRQWGIDDDLYLSRKLSGGRSGALVFFVDVSSKTFTGQAILKLDHALDPVSKEQHEAALHERAIKDAPEFAAKHLPRILHSVTHDNQVAILSTIAGRGLEYAEPWADCTYDRKLDVLREVSTGLLEDWNAGYRLNRGMHMPQELLQSWLAYRLDPADGGRIHGFLRDECGLPADTPSILFDGHWYPNPLAFAEGAVEVPERVRLRGVLGHSHGDFHGLNVLVGRRGGPNLDYYLIDLAMYESEQYLFFDHANFELASLLSSRGGASAAEWHTLVAQLSRFQQNDEQFGLRTEDIGLIELVRTLRNGVSAWIERHEADRLSFMDNQTLLARVAVGLCFSHKKLPLEARQMAFLYAAVNLKDYLKLNRVEWPKTGPAFEIGTGAAAPPDVRTRPAEPSAVPPPSAASPSAAPASPAKIAAPAPSPAAEEPEPVSDQASPVGKFFRELRRRHVLRVAGLYAVVAWLSIQVVTVLETPLRLPEWSGALVAVLLAVGLPIICAITWAFELGSAGLQRTRPAGDAPVNGTSNAVVDYAVMAGIVAIILFTGFEFLPSGDDAITTTPAGPAAATGPPQASEAQAATSLAVLPFKDLNGGGDDSFADGLTIEIFNVLAQTGAFRMPGVTSSFQYKGSLADLRAIGQSLNVEYLVEGTVRRIGDTLRIEAYLVRADDGFVIWSDTFRESMDNVFVAQEEVARAIGTALSTPLDIDADVLEARRTNDPRAYELFVRGLALLEQRGAPLRDAMTTLELAVEEEPDFAAAWAALSLVYNIIPTYLQEINGRPVRPALFYRRAKEAALRARQIDPDQPMVQHALGNMHQRDRQWAAAERAYEAALQDDPYDHRVMQDYGGLLMTVGKQAEALAYLVRAQELDPLNELYNLMVARLSTRDDQIEASVRVVEDIFLRSPQFRELALRIIIAYRAHTGELDKARALIEACNACPEALRTRALSMLDAAALEPATEIFEQYKDDVILGYQFLYAVGGPDPVFMAFAYNGLESPYRLQYFTVPWSLIDVLGPMEEFKRIVDDMGLEAYWRDRGWPEDCAPTPDGGFTCGSGS